MQYVFWLKITGRKTAAGSDFLFNGRIIDKRRHRNEYYLNADTVSKGM